MKPGIAPILYEGIKGHMRILVSKPSPNSFFDFPHL